MVPAGVYATTGRHFSLNVANPAASSTKEPKNKSPELRAMKTLRGYNLRGGVYLAKM